MRKGNFSSSNIWKLTTLDRKGTGLGAPALKYIKQVRYERSLGRQLTKEMTSKPTSWGDLAEKKAFELLDLSYQLVSKDRLYHPTLNWSGCPDLIKGKTIVADAKCPYSLEVFCDKLKALDSLETYKEEFPEDYWQHVSNSILLNLNGYSVDSFEAVIYCPYKSELESIRELASNYSGDDQYRFKWIAFSNDEELPYINDDGKYKNLNVFQFQIKKEDVEYLSKLIETVNPLIL